MKQKLFKALLRASNFCGGQAELAKVAGVTPACVSNWMRRNKKIPIQHVLRIEAALKGKMTKEEIRPDIYPPE